MAGAFGYEASHHALSLKMAELSLLPAVRKADPDVVSSPTAPHSGVRSTMAPAARRSTSPSCYRQPSPDQAITRRVWPTPAAFGPRG